MAWRRNKESSNAAFMDLTSDVCLNVHREEIISNARTNWELLRSQTKCIAAAKTSSSVLKDLKIESDFILTPINKPEIKSYVTPVAQRNKIIEKRIAPGTSKISVLPDKKLSVIRTSSQDTENSQNTSSSNTSNNEVFRLPPILVPIINKLENTNKDGLKRWGSLSSLGPNVDSSSFPSSSSSSDCESEKETAENTKVLKSNDRKTPVTTVTATSLGNTDTSSTISTATSGATAHSSSTSGSELSNSNTASCHSGLSKASSKRSIKSATSLRNNNHGRIIIGRAATAKPKVQKNISPTPPPAPPPQPPPSKDREQGISILNKSMVEFCAFCNFFL